MTPRAPAGSPAAARSAAPAITPTAARDRLVTWFASRGWSPATFQRRTWSQAMAGRSGLIHTPTGSGKTLAALGGPLIDGLADPTPRGGPRLRLLWVTPLRALAADTRRAIDEAVVAMALPWTVAMRTGDATATDRDRVRKGRAEVVVITPESLALLLSWPDADALLAGLRDVVVDEWHDLLGTKRGVALQLALARLRALRPGLRIWGLSATLGNLDEAMAVLLPGRGDAVRIDGGRKRAVLLQTLIPPDTVRLPWAGQLGLVHLADVLALVRRVRTSLVFTTTRAQAELWHQALASIWPEAPSTLALHHGSLDPGIRATVEAGLRDASVRCVVTTSSLDLGVDFPAVDQVIQIGSPRSALRLIQRAGRARHRPGESGRVIGVPTQALELLEFAATRAAVERGQVEARRPPRLCLDVLAQHCVTLAVGGGFDADTLLAEVRGTDAFAALTDAEWQGVIDFLTTGGSALGRYPEYHRVRRDGDGRYRVTDRAIAIRHRQNLGTIVDDGAISVRMQRGGRLGSVEERFIGQLRPGDRFRFAGRLLQLARVDAMTAWVRPATAGEGVVAVWQGGRLPMSDAIGSGIERLFGAALATDAATAPAPAPMPELIASRPLIALQAARSALPAPGRLLIERLRSRRGHHLALYPFAGRAAHEGLAALIAWRRSRDRADTVDYAVNDYGLMLTREAAFEVDAASLRDWLAPADLDVDLRASLNLGELARRQFRDIARIAGLIQPRVAGDRSPSTRQLQVSGGLLHDVLRRHDPGHPLLAQADREVLVDVLDRDRIAAVLERLSKAEPCIVDVDTFSPLAFALWAERERGQFSNEDWQTRVRKEAARLERRALAA